VISVVNSSLKQVVFVQHSTHLAGAQKSLSRLLTEQGMKSFSPLLLTGAEGWLTRFCSDHDVPWVRLEFPSPRSFKDRWLGGTARFAVKAAKALKPKLYADHSLIVHANDHPDSLIALHLAKILRSRSFLTLRTPGMSRRDFYKHRCFDHDCVIAVGDDLAQRAQQWHVNGKIHSVYNGVTENEIIKPNPLPDKTLDKILVIGSLSSRKGWQDLVDALILIEARFPEGQLPEVDFLGDLLDKNPLDVLNLYRLKRFRCRFLGVADDYLQHLQNYSLVVHPSRSESFGMAALECVSAGVPLIAASTGMIPNFIANKSFIYAPSDVQALADKLASFFYKLDCQDIFDAFDFETVHSKIRNNFTTDQTVEKLSQLYV
jgi:glycosyltransferase involved in cell wall biosynthesis